MKAFLELDVGNQIFISFLYFTGCLHEFELEGEHEVMGWF